MDAVEPQHPVLTALEIVRERWLRGQGHAGSSLLTSKGLMCCLGFMGQACGVPEASMVGVPAPSGLKVHPHREVWPVGVLADRFRGTNSGWTMRAMELNDEPMAFEAEREALLVEHFKQLNIDLTFK